MPKCDIKEAIEIAGEFLQEYHETIKLESSTMKGGVWHLVFDVGFLSQQLKVVEINATSRKIIGYDDLGEDEDEDED